jgi:hypothetical protein
MNKFFFSALPIFAITLTACSSLSAATTGNTTNQDLSVETQLAVGTLKLAGTDQDISSEQAQNLVVYWETYQQLSQSDTAAQEEVDALVAQIQETMTSDQMQAITDMNITQQDVFASMQGVTAASSNSSNNTVSVPSGSSSGGGMPAGGPPADGGGAPPDGGMGGDMGGAAPASSGSQTTASVASSTVTANVPSVLVQAVIEAMQQKIAAT